MEDRLCPGGRQAAASTTASSGLGLGFHVKLGSTQHLRFYSRLVSAPGVKFQSTNLTFSEANCRVSSRLAVLPRIPASSTNPSKARSARGHLRTSRSCSMFRYIHSVRSGVHGDVLVEGVDRNGQAGAYRGQQQSATSSHHRGNIKQYSLFPVQSATSLPSSKSFRRRSGTSRRWMVES